MAVQKIGHAHALKVEAVLLRVVRRANRTVRESRFEVVVRAKKNPVGALDDVVTNVDEKIQQSMIRELQKHFPGCGLICEEDETAIAPDGRSDLTFTVDPLDGTEVYRDGDLQGVSTMVACLHGDEIIAAYIGDAATTDVYGFGPATDEVRQIIGRNARPFGASRVARSPAESRALLRRPLERFSGITQELIRQFREYENTSVSSGIWATRLWRGAFGIGVLWSGTHETAWDMAPIVAISRKLGYVFLRPTEGDNGFTPYEPTLPNPTRLRTHDIILVHERNLEMIAPFLHH